MKNWRKLDWKPFFSHTVYPDKKPKLFLAYYILNRIILVTNAEREIKENTKFLKIISSLYSVLYTKRNKITKNYANTIHHQNENNSRPFHKKSLVVLILTIDAYTNLFFVVFA